MLCPPAWRVVIGNDGRRRGSDQSCTDSPKTNSKMSLLCVLFSPVICTPSCCASKQALRDVLEAIPYNDNDVYLHTDESLMPVRACCGEGVWPTVSAFSVAAPWLGLSVGCSNTSQTCLLQMACLQPMRHMGVGVTFSLPPFPPSRCARRRGPAGTSWDAPARQATSEPPWDGQQDCNSKSAQQAIPAESPG